MTKTKAEIIADIEFLSAMLTDTFSLPLKVKAQQTEINALNTKLDRVIEAQGRLTKRLDRLARAWGKV